MFQRLYTSHSVWSRPLSRLLHFSVVKSDGDQDHAVCCGDARGKVIQTQLASCPHFGSRRRLKPSSLHAVHTCVLLLQLPCDETV